MTETEHGMVYPRVKPCPDVITVHLYVQAWLRVRRSFYRTRGQILTLIPTLTRDPDPVITLIWSVILDFCGHRAEKRAFLEEHPEYNPKRGKWNPGVDHTAAASKYI